MTEKTKAEEMEYHKSAVFSVAPGISEEVFDVLKDIQSRTEQLSGAEKPIDASDIVIGEVQHYHLTADEQKRAVMVPVPEPRGDETFEEMDAIAKQQLAILQTSSKLTPDELAAFSPKCAYCGGPIDHERARKRKKTCSDEHTRLYQQYRRFLWSMTRCPSCYRPSTPDERKEFKAWRAHRGDVLKTVGRGRPSKTRERQMTDGIEKLMKTIEERVEEGTFVQSAGELVSALKAILSANHG